MTVTRLLLALLAPLAFTPALRASPPPAADPVAAAWELSTLYIFKESYRDFLKLDSREALLGRATLLLLQQPKTNANLDASAALLEKLAAPLPGPVPVDETAIASRYLLGRIAHIHRPQPDLAVAAGHYRRLVAEHPAHLLADQARIKLALIELYAPGLSPDDKRAAHARFAAIAEQSVLPSTRRDLHLVLANAARNLDLGDATMLHHYLAAEASGLERPVVRANVLVAIGELARRLGRDDLSRRAFTDFLASYKRDTRRLLVKDKLATLRPATPITSTEASR